MKRSYRTVGSLMALLFSLGAGGCLIEPPYGTTEAILVGQTEALPPPTYNLPSTIIVRLTNTQPGQPTGLNVVFSVALNQLETFSAVVTVPAAFTFNGFDTLGPAGTPIGTYGFDFSPFPNFDGLAEFATNVYARGHDSAYVDANYNGVFDAAIDPSIVHTVDGSGNHVFTATMPLGGDGTAFTVTAPFALNVIATLTTGILTNPTTPGPYTIPAVFTSVDPDTDGPDNGTGPAPLQISTSRDVTVGAASLLAAVLPSSRAVAYGTAATTFASVINTGAGTAMGCSIAPLTAIPTKTFLYQKTDASTNLPSGTPNTPVNIPSGGIQTFLIALTPANQFLPSPRPIVPTQIEFLFQCTNVSAAAPSVPGLNALLLSADGNQPPDVIAVSATATNNGIAVVPGVNGIGAFGVSGVNIGTAATMVVRPVARPGLPVTLTVCETTNSPGATCLATPAATVQAVFGVNVVRTFSVFVTGTGTTIPVDLAGSRATVQFEELNGTIRGATNVAIQNGPP